MNATAACDELSKRFDEIRCSPTISIVEPGGRRVGRAPNAEIGARFQSQLASIRHTAREMEQDFCEYLSFKETGAR